MRVARRVSAIRTEECPRSCQESPVSRTLLAAALFLGASWAKCHAGDVPPDSSADDSASATTADATRAPTTTDWAPVHEHPLLGSVPPFRTTILAAEPTDGGMRPSRGYAHYDLPSRHYGIWFRPTSYGRQCAERCRPAEFNPRGYGRLFARSSLCYRMDYDPYVLPDERNAYGPAYMADPVPYECDQCRLFGRRCRDCERRSGR